MQCMAGQGYVTRLGIPRQRLDALAESNRTPRQESTETVGHSNRWWQWWQDRLEGAHTRVSRRQPPAAKITKVGAWPPRECKAMQSMRPAQWCTCSCTCANDAAVAPLVVVQLLSSGTAAMHQRLACLWDLSTHSVQWASRCQSRGTSRLPGVTLPNTGCVPNAQGVCASSDSPMHRAPGQNIHANRCIATRAIQ